MKKLFALFLLMLGIVNVFGQNTNQNERTILRINCAPTKTDPTKSPMLIVNGKYIVYPMEDFGSRFRVDDIQDLNIYKNTDSLIRLYGEKAKNGVIGLELKKGAAVMKMDELFDSFNIKEKYRSLPLYVNEQLIKDKAGFFISSVMVRKVKVVDKPTAGVSDLEFISIKTKP